MKTEIQEFEVAIPNADRTAIAERITVKVPVWWDENVQDWILTPEAHQIIDDTEIARGMKKP